MPDQLLLPAPVSRVPHRSWGGTRLTTVLCFFAFAAVANTVGSGLQFVYAAHHQLHSLALAVDVSATVLLVGWALARVRADGGAEAALSPIIPAREADVRASRPSKRAPSWKRRLRWLVLAAVCVLATVAIVSRWGTLEAAFGQLKHLRWGTLRWGIYAEAMAMVAFAQLIRLQLRAGGVKLRLGSMIGLTVASNALAVTLPGGPAWAVTFSFDQLRRRGVSRSLTAYALAVTWTMSGLGLVVIALVGVELAGGLGPAAPFRAVAIGVMIAITLMAIAGAVAVRSPRCRGGLGRRLDRWCTGPRSRAVGESIRAGARELSGVHLPVWLVASCVAAAVMNWIFDCGCLVFAILAVGGHVPWQGILAAYGLTQLAAALPITPGGIGVVEGTLSILLIAYHMPAAPAIAAVLLYRIISFWLLVPIGWGAVATLLAMPRRGRAQAAWIFRRARRWRPRAAAEPTSVI